MGDCSGSFRLSFRGQLTTALAPEADDADIEAALEALSSIGDVTVTLATGTQGVCEPSNTASVQFVTEHGDLPPIRVVRSAHPFGTSSCRLAGRGPVFLSLTRGCCVELCRLTMVSQVALLAQTF